MESMWSAEEYRDNRGRGRVKEVELPGRGINPKERTATVRKLLEITGRISCGIQE